MGRGKRSAIQVLDFLGCSISATIGIVSTFHCGPWPCIGIYGRAERCGLTKCVSRYSRPGVIEPIVEQSACVIRWAWQPPSGSSVNPIAIFAATRWELQAVRRALAADGVAAIAGVRYHIGQQKDR